MKHKNEVINLRWNSFLKFLVVLLFLFSFADRSHAKEQPSKNFLNGFNVDITGHDTYSFGDFNQVGYKITPLAQLFLAILQTEHEWIDEPLLYLKGNKGYFHLWKEDGTNVLYTVKKQPSKDSAEMWGIVEVQRNKVNRIPVSKTLLKEALIERLVDPISEAITHHYGEFKLWSRGEEKILHITNDEGNILVTVQVTTFEGAHNPPYGEEIITFHILSGGDVKEVNYYHRDIPENEHPKLKFR